MKADKIRTKLFQYLDECLALSHKKLHTKKKDDDQCLKWGRLLVQAIQVYGKLLETEELEERVAKLEETIREGLVIPGEIHK